MALASGASHPEIADDPTLDAAARAWLAAFRWPWVGRALRCRTARCGGRCGGRRGGRLAVALAGLAVLVAPSPAQRAEAQEDWSLTRPRRSGSAAPGGRRARRPRRGLRRRPGRARSQPPAAARAPSASSTERTRVLIARYSRIVEADPRESFAFSRLLDLYRERDGTLEPYASALEARLTEADSYAPHMLLGHIERARGRLERAGELYRAAVALRPDAYAPPLSLARVERAASRYPGARQLYDRVLALVRAGPLREEVLREAAELALSMDDLDAAQGYFRQLAGRDVYSRTAFARALVEGQHYPRAVEEYQRIVRSLRGDRRVLPPILVRLAQAQSEAGSSDEALQTLHRASRLAGRDAAIRAEIDEALLRISRGSDRLAALAERLRSAAGMGRKRFELLGRVEEELGRHDAALAAFRRALRVRPGHIDARVRMVRLLLTVGRLDEAVREYRQLVRVAPREPRFLLELAQLLRQTDRGDEALALLRQAQRRHPRDPDLHQRIAEVYRRWGEDRLADEAVARLARIDPTNPSHLVALGTAQFAAGRRAAALATWRRLVRIGPDPGRALAMLGGVLADHDLLAEAASAYEEAVRLRPNDIDIARSYATLLERRRQPRAAETQWQSVLRLGDGTARREARRRLVGIWQRTGRLAAKLVELAARFGAGDAGAGRQLAEAYRRSRPPRTAEAERVLSALAELEPGDLDSLRALAQLKQQRGDLDGAIRVLRSLRDADPRRAGRYLRQMADHALALYRDDDALRYAEEAVEQNPEDASAHRRLGDLHRARQQAERAAECYQRALALNERLYPVYLQLAEIHLAAGRVAEADRRYRSLLRLTPDDDLAARAARASIQIHLGAGTLRDLEAELLGLAIDRPQRPVFRRLVVELYEAYAGRLVALAQGGGPVDSALPPSVQAARNELRALGQRAIKPLLEALSDSDPAQRRVALRLLGPLGNRSAAAPLLSLAENRTLDRTVRMEALLAAGTLAEEGLADRLFRLTSDQDSQVSALAAWGLSRLGSAAAFRHLRGVAANRTRAAAYAMLGVGFSSDPSRVDLLLSAANRQTGETMRAAIAYALGAAGDRRGASFLLDAVYGHERLTARVAVWALGRLGGAEARRGLARALFDPDRALSFAAARAFATESRPVGVEALIPPLLYESPANYLERVTGGASPAPFDLAPLVPALLGAASAGLRASVPEARAVLEALSNRPDGIGAGPLTTDESGLVGRSEGARAREAALAELRRGLLQPLLRAAARPEPAVRRGAIPLLARLYRTDASLAQLEAALSSSADQKLALLGLSASHRPLPEALSPSVAGIARVHADWSVRLLAVRALAQGRDAVARHALRRAVESDPYAFVREAAAQALGRSGDGPDASALERVRLRDDEPRVRRAAADARASILARIGRER